MAAASLVTTIDSIYTVRYGWSNGSENFFTGPGIFSIEQSIRGDSFEIPTTFMPFMYEAAEGGVDTLIMPFFASSSGLGYTTFDANIKRLLYCSWHNQLVRMDIDNCVYYVAPGCIFNNAYQPIMICTWEVNRIDPVDNKYFIKSRPVLRIAPECTARADKMQRFICGKLIDTAINTSLNDFYMSGFTRTFSPRQGNYSIKIIIDNIPFIINKVKTPSISTSNKELLELAKEPLETLSHDYSRLFQ